MESMKEREKGWLYESIVWARESMAFYHKGKSMGTASLEKQRSPALDMMPL